MWKWHKWALVNFQWKLSFQPKYHLSGICEWFLSYWRFCVDKWQKLNEIRRKIWFYVDEFKFCAEKKLTLKSAIPIWNLKKRQKIINLFLGGDCNSRGGNNERKVWTDWHEWHEWKENVSKWKENNERMSVVRTGFSIVISLGNLFLKISKTFTQIFQINFA